MIMNLQKKKIAIIGAGIAGLSTAYNFKNSNDYEVTIFEKENSLPDTGLGFLIMSNGMETFEKMGIDNVLRSNGTVINNYLSVDNHENRIKESTLENCLAISRSNCIQSVYDLLDSNSVQFGKELIDYTSNNNFGQHTLHFKDGSSFTADLLIGADGIHSKIRNKLYPNHEIRIVKEKEIVGVVKHPELAKKIGNTLLKVVNPLKGINMGLLPSLNGELIWYIQLNEDKIQAPENTPVALEQFCKRMTSEMPDDFKQAINATDFETAYLWKMADVEIIPSFHKDGILLIGDAAHPVLAFTSQGVNSALEDSYLLANLLADGTNQDLKAAFDEFDKIRRPIISDTLEGGRQLLDQFLQPGKYNNIYIPFVDQKFSFSK